MTNSNNITKVYCGVIFPPVVVAHLYIEQQKKSDFVSLRNLNDCFAHSFDDLSSPGLKTMGYSGHFE